MPKFSVSRNLPAIIPHSRVRNDLIPDWRDAYFVARQSNFALAHARKHVFSASGGTSSTGTYTQWWFAFRSGEASETSGSLQLVVSVLARPPTTRTAGTAWTFYYNDGGGETAAPTQYFRSWSGSLNMEEWSLKEIRVDIDADTEYECRIRATGNIILVSAMAYEAHGDTVDTTDSVVCDLEAIADGNPIYDATLATLNTAPHALWRHNGAHLCSLATPVNQRWSTTSTSYVNVLDTSASTTVTATTPGVNFQVRYHNPYHSANVTTVFKVFAADSANGGAVLAADSGGGIATLINFASTGEWKQTTMTLDGTTDGHKVDFHMQTTSGTMTVYTICVYEYVT